MFDLAPPRYVHTRPGLLPSLLERDERVGPFAQVKRYATGRSACRETPPTYTAAIVLPPEPLFPKGRDHRAACWCGEPKYNRCRTGSRRGMTRSAVNPQGPVCAHCRRSLDVTASVWCRDCKRRMCSKEWAPLLFLTSGLAPYRWVGRPCPCLQRAHHPYSENGHQCFSSSVPLFFLATAVGCARRSNPCTGVADARPFSNASSQVTVQFVAEGNVCRLQVR